nr:retrovirus-related Pol polyprotein from transposon TNT 1-94 [Tanacetum cinerariifolium]
MGSKEEAERIKRKGLNLEQDSAKKQKTSEEVPEKVKSPKEIPEEKVKEMMQLVPIEEVYVEALQVKHPIINWKVYHEGQRSYWKITRLGGSSASYQFFIDLLKHLDREDLNQLWKLVKETLSNRPPTKWKLYDSYGVHHVTSKDKEIFTLVEKDYPLRQGLVLVMISYKLQVENYSQMVNDLILKIYKIANSPRQQGPGIQCMTPTTSSSELISKPILQQPCILPPRDDWDHLFQPMFDEYFNPPTIYVSPVSVAAAPRAVDLADSPVFTSIDQDAPSKSIPSTQDQEHSPIISQGFKQDVGTDFEESFTPVARIEAIRIFVANAANKNMTIFQMNVKTTSLNYELKQEVYVSQPEVFVNQDNPSHVYKLKKALYGIKQAPRAWYNMLSSFLISQNFSKGAVDLTLFTLKAGNDLLLDTGMSLTAYADADHMGCQDTRHITSGSTQLLGDKFLAALPRSKKSCLLHHLQLPTFLSTPILSQGGYFRELTRSYRIKVLRESSCTVPQDEDEREPMFIQPHDPDYVPEPMYPEYIPLEDEHVLPAEEHQLPPIVSPAAESPGYVTESDPEEDPEEYEDDETEDGLEDEEEEDEEEDLAPAYSAVVIPTLKLVSPPEGTEPVIPPPFTDTTTTRARITVWLQASIPLPPEAEIERHLVMPTLPPSPLTSLSPPSARERLARCTTPSTHSSSPPVPSPLLPSSECPTQIETLRMAYTQALIDVVTVALPSPLLPPLPPPLYIPPPVVRRDDIPETEMPPRKRSCLFTLGPKYEVGESSTVRPTRGRGIDYGFVSALDAEARRRGIGEVVYGIKDAWIDLIEAVLEIVPMTLGETEMAKLQKTDRRRQVQMVETLRVMGDMRREMGDMQAELLALREQPRRARQPGSDARFPDY